jgi:HEPN domain-containing protein
MAKDLQNSFLERAETDLKAARVLVKEGLFSQSLYMVEQALEKDPRHFMLII